MSSSLYQPEGGGLFAGAPTYVRREADDILRELATQERPSCGVCYILAPRQTGKTSLMNQSADELKRMGIICVQISLQGLGNFDPTASASLYFNLLRLICQKLALHNSQTNSQLHHLVATLDAVWYRTLDLQPALRFKEFLITEVLAKINHRVVIFIDEIQSLIGWQLQDEWIGFLKSLCETSNEPSLKQLAFVLLGCAKPSDLVTNYIYAFNFGQQIELNYLTGDCKPLQQGLATVTTKTAPVLTAILNWTGGQPFLTQVLCSLVEKGSPISANTDVEDYIDQLVRQHLLNNWKQQDPRTHFHNIENWFRRAAPAQKATKLAALRIYRRLLTSSQGSIKFDEDDSRHWELLISGIVKKEGVYLEVANLIYAHNFNLAWVSMSEQYLQEDSMPLPPFSTIYNRDVFILIDQSGSMIRKDAQTGVQTRYQYLQEVVEGNIYSILSATSNQSGQEGEKICDYVSVYFFSTNTVADYPIKVHDAGQVQSLFLENKPKTKTFIGPTLDRCLDIWVAEGKPKGRGAFFIIYTDGLFDDEPRFIECLKKACQKVDDEKEVKFLILGLGTDINEMAFLNLDYNVSNELLYNIMMFNLVNEVDEIILELERELVDNPGLAFPEWVKQRHPDFVKRVREAHQQ